MFKKIVLFGLLAIVVGLGIFAGVVAMQPEELRVERKITIAAPPADVFPHVDDFHKWDAWSPWAKLDPNAKNTFEGPSAGKGAILKWEGNKDVGKGSMTILESQPPEKIRIKLDFVEPMEDTSMVDFTFKADGDKTIVTWTMHGKNNFVGKAFCLIMNAEKMIGEKFEEGLTTLKATVESKKAD